MTSALMRSSVCRVVDQAARLIAIDESVTASFAAQPRHLVGDIAEPGCGGGLRGVGIRQRHRQRPNARRVPRHKMCDDQARQLVATTSTEGRMNPRDPVDMERIPTSTLADQVEVVRARRASRDDRRCGSRGRGHRAELWAWWVVRLGLQSALSGVPSWASRPSASCTAVSSKRRRSRIPHRSTSRQRWTWTPQHGGHSTHRAWPSRSKPPRTRSPRARSCRAHAGRRTAAAGALSLSSRHVRVRSGRNSRQHAV